MDAEITIKTRLNLTAVALSPEGKRQSNVAVIQEEHGVSLNTGDVRSPWVLLVKR